MTTEAVTGSLRWTVRELRDALDNASAAYVTLADANPLGARAVWDLMQLIGQARARAEELLSLATDDDQQESDHA
jgi:hypothetical protein